MQRVLSFPFLFFSFFSLVFFLRPLDLSDFVVRSEQLRETSGSGPMSSVGVAFHGVFLLSAIRSCPAPTPPPPLSRGRLVARFSTPTYRSEPIDYRLGNTGRDPFYVRTNGAFSGRCVFCHITSFTCIGNVYRTNTCFQAC